MELKRKGGSVILKARADSWKEIKFSRVVKTNNNLTMKTSLKVDLKKLKEGLQGLGFLVWGNCLELND